MNTTIKSAIHMLLLVMFAFAAVAVLVAGKIPAALLPWTGAVRERASPDFAPLAHQKEAKAREVERRFNQAVVMLHAKQYEHALTALHRVLELAPAMPEAHVNMGYTLLGLKRFATARDFFSGAIELRPMQANAYYGLALALDAQNDRLGARGAMRSFVHLARPDDPFLRKARSALWEWQSSAAQNSAVDQHGSSRESTAAPAALKDGQ